MFMGKDISIAVFLLGGILVYATNVPIKIVREPASYGLFGNNFAQDDHSDQLVARAKPANFSGPVHLKRLVGRCFNHSSGDYRYIFCPFKNMTQFETSFRWNAYKGVLGVWSGWKIENGSFTAMMFTHGDKCGQKDRSSEVSMVCGPQHLLSNVSEPDRCQYHAIFSTPLVCHNDAMLVYPRMSKELRERWVTIENEYHNEELTEKGYRLQLEKMFEEAGFIQTPEPTSAPSLTATNGMPDAPFTNIGQCNSAYHQLKQELEVLRKHIDDPTTTKLPVP